MRLTTRTLPFFLLIVSALMTMACSPIKSLVNQRWPPISVADQQRVAIDTANRQLRALDRPDVFVRLAREDITSLAQDEIKKRLPEAGIDLGVAHGARFSNIGVELVEQGIRVQLDYDLTLTKVKAVETVHLAGSLEGTIAVNTTDARLQLRPAFSRAEVREIGFGKGWGGDFLVPIVDLALHNFLDNVNARFRDPVELDLALKKHLVPDFDKLFATNDRLTIGAAKIGEVNVALGPTAILIRPEGIAVLAEVGTEAVDTADAVEAGAPDATPGLPVSFAQYAASFSAMADAFPAPKSGTTVLVQKDLLERILNRALSLLRVDFTYHLADQRIPFAKEIDRGVKEVKDCGGLRKACPPSECNKECSGESCDRDCNVQSCGTCASYSCDHNCGKWNAWCKAQQKACETERGAREALCRTKVESCNALQLAKRKECQGEIAACKVRRETKRIACQAEVQKCKLEEDAKCLATKVANETRVTECKSAREALRIVDQAVRLGSVSGAVSATGITIEGDIGAVAFTGGLQRVMLDFGVKASSGVDVQVRFVPKGLGGLACVAGFDKTFSNVAVGSVQRRGVDAAITTETRTDGTLVLKLTTEPIDVEAQLVIPPLLMMAPDLELQMKCMLGVAALEAAAAYVLTFDSDKAEMVLGHFTHRFPPQTLEIPVRVMDLQFGKRKIALLPLWNRSTIGFSGTVK